MSRTQILAAVLATIAGLVAVVVDQTSGSGDSPPTGALTGGVTVGFAVLLFAGAVPRAQGRIHSGPRAAETALVTSVVGFLSVASAWSGLPFVLGAGGAMLGSAARDNASQPRELGLAGLAIALGVVAVVLGVVTVAVL
jgi:hypothetical protein